MTLKQIECFLRLSDNLNFAKTAEELYMTQPTVTREIQSLESELRVRLFSRTKRVVELTPAGQMLKAELRPLYSGLNSAIAKAQSCQERFRSQLRIGFCNSASVLLLPEAMRRFHKDYPEVQFRLCSKSLGELHALFAVERLDVLFGMNDALIQGLKDGMQVLYKGYLCVLVPKGHDLYKEKVLRIEDLNGYQMIFQEQSYIPALMNRVLERIYQKCPNCNYTYLDNVEEIQMMILAGMGISVAPQYSFMPSPYYRQIPLDTDNMPGMDTLDYCILWHTQNTGNHVEKFVELMRQLYSGL